MALTYQDIINMPETAFAGYSLRGREDLQSLLKQHNLYDKASSFNGPFAHYQQGPGIRQELLNRMRASQPSPQPQQPASYTGGPVGQPANQAPLPQGTNSGYQPPANAANPVQNGPSWQAGPQTQKLPPGTQSPYGQAWGGGEGTTYNPITMNQQASLLSQNHQAPNGWLNGLLYNSPWEEYYGVQGGNGLL